MRINFRGIFFFLLPVGILSVCTAIFPTRLYLPARNYVVLFHNCVNITSKKKKEIKSARHYIAAKILISERNLAEQ